MIDAEAGRVPRRADEDDDFDAVVRATGSHPTVQLFEGWGPIVRDLSEGSPPGVRRWPTPTTSTSTTGPSVASRRVRGSRLERSRTSSPGRTGS
ncbi:hypothetical protein D8S78_07070 [Natrialba swarupiae]|nr:hypothetical protein [Natrialba swarupiae]